MAYQLLELEYKTATPDDINFLCLQSGIDVNVKNNAGYTPLHLAVINSRDPEVITILINNGADVNEENHASNSWTPLHLAAKYNESLEIINILLNNDADVNAKDGYGKIPLHFAAQFSKSAEIISELVVAGAEIKTEDIGGESPFDYLRKNPNISEEEQIYRVLQEGNS